MCNKKGKHLIKQKIKKGKHNLGRDSLTIFFNKEIIYSILLVPGKGG